MALDCLDGLVGLANRECECASASRPSAWNSSQSGYYLTDREYGFPVKDALFANLDCGETTIWDTLTEARTQAIRDFKLDLQQALGRARDSRVISWRGTVGKAEATSYFTSAPAHVGVQIRPKHRLKDAVFIIKALHVGLNTTKTVNLTISSNRPDFSAQSVSATATAGTWVRTELSSSVELPLYDIARTDVKYNIRYQPGGALPRYNKIWCCSRPRWQQHIAAHGIEQSGTWDEDAKALGDHGYGLAIEGYFTCNKLDWICDLEEMNGLDFRDLVARCIQYKGAIKLISAILESGKINFYTLLDQEGLYRKRSKLGKLYVENLQWIAHNLPANVSSCWGCHRGVPTVEAVVV